MMYFSHPWARKIRAVLFVAISIVGWFVYLGISAFLMLIVAFLLWVKWLIFDFFFREYFHYLGIEIGVALLKIWQATMDRLPVVFDYIGLPPPPEELKFLNPSNMPCLIVRAAYILGKPNPITFCLGVVSLVWYGVVSLLHIFSA
jgi:hypothetical protein